MCGFGDSQDLLSGRPDMIRNILNDPRYDLASGRRQVERPHSFVAAGDGVQLPIHIGIACDGGGAS
jgi:hypothetical protein